MRIAIAGAGAIGGWLGVRLADRGHDVGVLARGDTLAALRTGEWRLLAGDETRTARVRASDDAADLGPQDVVFATVKGPALPDLAPRLRPLLGDKTIIVPMMNGVPWWFLLNGVEDIPAMPLRSVDPTGAIAASLPIGQVLGCVVHAAVAVQAPGVVRLNAGNRLILGELDGSLSPRLQGVAALLEDAGFQIDRSADVRYDIWYKLWGNMTMNPMSAITGATCDRILDDPLVADLTLRIMAEAQAIGARIGCVITERGEDRMGVTRKLGAFKTSMLQDVEAGRMLELDQLLGAPREIAQRLGMATPNIDALLGLARLFGRTRGLYPN